MDIQERLGKLLQGEEIRLFILKSSLQELHNQGSKAATSLAFAQSFCEVLDDDSSIGETIEEKVCHFITSTREEAARCNKARQYMVASQDKGFGCCSPAFYQHYFTAFPLFSLFLSSCDPHLPIDLRQSLGRIPGVPLIYLNKVIMVLEPPSDSSVRYNKKNEVLKSALQESEEEIVSKLKARGIGVVGEGSTESGDKSKQQRKKRKATASNPLSCKKNDPDSNRAKRTKKDKFKRRGGGFS